FVYASEVTFLDLQELLQDVQGAAAAIRFLDSNDTAMLRDQCRTARQLSDCSNDQIASLMKVLIPFKTVEDIFLHNVPSFEESTGDAGPGYPCMRRRVCIY